MATSLFVVRCLRRPSLLGLAGLLLASWPYLTENSRLSPSRPPCPSAYYQRVFADFTRESPFLLVRISWHGQRQELGVLVTTGRKITLSGFVVLLLPKGPVLGYGQLLHKAFS